MLGSLRRAAWFVVCASGADLHHNGDEALGVKSKGINCDNGVSGTAEKREPDIGIFGLRQARYCALGSG